MTGGDPPHIGRVQAEAAELEDRLGKLTRFIASAAFRTLERPDRDLLISQQRAMSNYLFVLVERLARFDAPRVTP